MENGSNFTYLNMNDILPNRFQPRIHFDDYKLNELAESIRKYGVIEPIIVRQIGNKYEIIAGERRFKASRLAGKSVIPTIVINLTDKESEEIALLENVQRQNLTPIEEAVSYKRILDMGYITQEELAKKLGKSQSTIANKIRLLNLDDEVQYALLNGKISERHARSLLRLHNNYDQIKMLNRIIDERLTVKKTDDAIKELLEQPKAKQTEEVEELFTEPLPKKVKRAVAVASHEIIKVNPPQEIEERIKREEGKNMDIDKIMQEAQDINAQQTQKDLTGVMQQTPNAGMPGTVTPVTPEPVTQTAEPQPMAENPDIPLSNDGQNKFVNFAGIMADNPAPAENPTLATPEASTPNNAFDSMFNYTPTNLQTPSSATPEPAMPAPAAPTPIETPAPQIFDNPIPQAGTNTNDFMTVNNTPMPNQEIAPGLTNNSLNPATPSMPVNNTVEPSMANNNSAIAAAVQRAINSDLPEKPMNDSAMMNSANQTENNPALYNELIQTAPLVGNSEQAPMPSPMFTAGQEPIASAAPMQAESTTPNNNFFEVIKLIRNCASEIEKMGYYIDVDEMDLQNSYQATFKINKDK